MSIDIAVERRIERKREEVAAFATDPADERRWIGALTSVRKLTEGPVAPGTRVERVASFLGRRIDYVNEVVEHKPAERLVMRSVKAPFPMTVTYEFEDDGGATRMRIRAQGDAGGFYRGAGPLLGVMVRRGIARDLNRLKRLLESS